MNVIMVGAWMLWSPDAVKHERYYDLGMDGHQMQSNMNVVMVWAWMLWTSDAIENERSHGLGMDGLVIGRSRK